MTVSGALDGSACVSLIGPLQEVLSDEKLNPSLTDFYVLSSARKWMTFFQVLLVLFVFIFLSAVFVIAACSSF